MKKKASVLDLISKHYKLIILALIAMIIFNQWIVFVITVILFTFLGMSSVSLSRVMPQISIETITPSAILVGYIWGWQFGLGFGLIVGMVSYVNASQMNLTTIICSLLMGLVGVLAFLFKDLGFNFFWSFQIVYFIRANLSYFLISRINSNVVENIMHSYVESIYNMVIIVNFMTLFHGIIISLI
jgi:hypothetical protein